MSNNTLAKQGKFTSLHDQVHTPRMQRIISKPPSWLLKWGITLFFAVFVLIVVLARFISYPDIVKSSLTIISVEDLSSVRAIAFIQQADYNRVSPNQQVLIRLKSYPVHEFGSIRGTVTKINDSPGNDGTFAAQVLITKQGLEEFKKPLNLKSGLEADADIITQDISLWKRVYTSVLKKM